MFKLLRLFVLLATVILNQFAVHGQARVQLIHNSPDTANQYFDIWIGTSKVFNNLPFRTATAFVDVPAGNQISILLTDSASVSPENPKLIFRYTFQNNSKYMLVIQGMESSQGYNPFYELAINMYVGAREQASNAAKTDVLFLQGSTDLPESDLVEANLGLISNNLHYLDFDGYFGFNPADNILFVKENANQSTLYSYELPLVSLGLQGQACAVLMSGFVDPSANNLGKPFGMFMALPEGGSLIPLPVYSEPMAPLQFVHNSPNPEADSLDLWIDGRLAANNIKFRTATAYLMQPAGRSITLALCDANSLNANDPILASSLVLTENVPYQVVLSGMTETTGYDPPTPAALFVYAPARSQSVVTGNTDLLFCNGSTDFSPLKVNEITTPLGTLTSNLSFGAFDGYEEVLTANYAFDVRNPADEVVAVYDASFSSMAMENKAVTILSSGFFDKTANNNGPAFGLYVVPQEGGSLISLPPYTPPTFAELQFINNSADKACDTVDVWINSEKVIAGLPFREASAMIQVTAGTEQLVAVKPFESTSSDSPMTTVSITPEAGTKHGLFLTGIQSASGYTPSPALEMMVIDNMRVNASSGGVCDVMVLHQSTDAPTPADFIELNSVWLLGMTYGQHSNYMQKPVGDYSVGFRHPDSAMPYNYYFLPVEEIGFAGRAFFVLTSGFFNPAANSNGPAFGLWGVVPSGGKMVELTKVTGIGHGDESDNLAVYPNPAHHTLWVKPGTQQGTLSLEILSLAGQRLTHQVERVQGEPLPLDISNLSAGTYLLKAVVNGHLMVRRIVVAD